MQLKTVLAFGLSVLVLSCAFVEGQDDVMEAMDIEQHKEADKCPVSKHGAVGDGKTLDTVAIQTAIDDCGAREDGGIVEFEAGKTYLSGSLQIPSRMSLSLPKKTVLKASTAREHYPNQLQDWKFLRIDKATRVSILGPGQINGQAQQWTQKYEGKPELKSWYDEKCMETSCRPGLIGIRDSSQITIQSIDLKDFVDIAVHIDKSDAVAIVDTRIIADLGLDGPDGIVVDSGKRVYIGETEIQAPGFSIWAGTSTNSKALESLLVDGVKLKSKTAAIQIGPNVKADAKTIVVQNAEILTCKRGISLQLQDSGNIKDVWFTNITVRAVLADDDAYGSAEAIFASVKADYYGAQVGKMSAIWFGNIKAETEGGIVFSGDPRSVIDGITLKDSSISLKKLTDSPGGSRDFRPFDMPVEDDFNIPIIYLEYANHVTLNNTQVSFGSPRREEWYDLLQITPRSVHALDIGGVSLHDASAHASDASLPMKKITQLGDFFKHSVQDFINSINKKGFISVQENAATGVQGRKAASSGGPIIMVILFAVLMALAVRYLCIPTWQTLRSKRDK